MTDTTTEHKAAPEQLKQKLEDLRAAATREYSLKNYHAAAEHFSEAAEIQDEINGEMSPENADLLYQYGRCLYHVAVSKSDVLGGKVAGTEEPKRKKRKVAAESSTVEASNSGDLIRDAIKTGEEQRAGKAVEVAVEEEEEEGTKSTEAHAVSKPFFQITGDEDFTDSEDEEEGVAPEEDEDDFAIAYEILDVARVLLRKKLTVVEETAGKETKDKPEVRQIKERLADTHDLQAEISLENERFHDAINDTRDSLALKLQLYPEENSLIAEAHFKLSLALEFASLMQTQEDGEGEGEGEKHAENKIQQIDKTMRKEAAAEMEKAIASCKLRIAKEEAELSTMDAAKAEGRKKAIVDVKEMVTDMEERLVELNLDPVSAANSSDPLRGILGAMLGESHAEQQKRVAEAAATANDLTGLVKHKKKSKVEDGEPIVKESGKRKSEDILEEPNAKKAKAADN